jgi:hypothetical protein
MGGPSVEPGCLDSCANAAGQSSRAAVANRSSIVQRGLVIRNYAGQPPYGRVALPCLPLQ